MNDCAKTVLLCYLGWSGLAFFIAMVHSMFAGRVNVIHLRRNIRNPFPENCGEDASLVLGEDESSAAAKAKPKWSVVAGWFGRTLLLVLGIGFVAIMLGAILGYLIGGPVGYVLTNFALAHCIVARAQRWQGRRFAAITALPYSILHLLDMACRPRVAGHMYVRNPECVPS